MSAPSPEMQAVHARMDQSARQHARGGRWWWNQARQAKAAEDDKVISAEELEQIYERAEQKESR